MQDKEKQTRLSSKKVMDAFENWHNLLNFMPTSVFYGQRPSAWWTLRHDIDLLYGTYKYGYAAYTAMRIDVNLSFYRTEKVTEGQYQEFPNADNITRRLKKLVQIIGRPEYAYCIDFVRSINEDEPSNLVKEEKQTVCQILCEHGLPVTAEGKDDFNWIKDEMQRRLRPTEQVATASDNKEAADAKPQLQETESKQASASVKKEKEAASEAENKVEEMKDADKLQAEKNLLANISTFVIRVRMVAQQIIQHYMVDDDAEEGAPQEKDKEPSPPKPKSEFIFDPDQDGFSLPLELALKLHCNTNLLTFIRRNFQIVHGAKSKKEPKAFMSCLPVLVSKFEPAPFSAKWTVRKHDLSLLKIVSKEGLIVFEESDDKLRQLMRQNEDFADLEEGVIDKLEASVLLKRVEDLCKGSREEPVNKTMPIKRPAPVKTSVDVGGADDDDKEVESQKQSGQNKRQKTEQGSAQVKNEDSAKLMASSAQRSTE